MKKVITRKSAFLLRVFSLVCYVSLVCFWRYSHSAAHSVRNLWPREQEIPMAALSGLARLIITTSPTTTRHACLE